MTGQASSPFLPSAPRPAPAPAEAPVFDAKAMVESQKHINTNPAYGPLPAGTDEGRAAAQQLRAQANRKRRRNRRIGWFVGVVFLGVVVAAGWLAVQALRDEQGAGVDAPVEGEADEAIDDASAPADGDADDGDADDGDADDASGGALSPVGEEVEALEVMDDLNSTAQPGGGLLDAIDDARDAVGQVNGEPDTAAPDDATGTDPGEATDTAPDRAIGTDPGEATDTDPGEATGTDPGPSSLSFVQLMPPSVLAHADVLESVDGYERYYVRGPDLAAADPAAWQTLVDTLAQFPELPAGDERRTVLPVVLADDVAVAVKRDGDRVTELIGVLTDSEIRVVGS